LNPEGPGTSRADTSALGLKWVRQQYPAVSEMTQAIQFMVGKMV
jgi:hypothetical protein